ncbi:MAG: hypothetical protein Q8N02_03500 [Methylotenera sp.]|nr:hypothetical protein [Methylotenera sp.]MDO9232088.1 hypothetical protein [Methylotenera sp.]MDP2101337.1 hypothetical protein [Methylotenera sp.]MDP2281616.1 hypothetical protein [Methylotenera sp.]MDP2402789.1 hypothetical protein [Methylotenera sp.]
MDTSREKEAISAYFKLLQHKGAKAGVLYKRSLFLDQLAPLLAGKLPDRSSYSQAIDTLIKKISPDIWHESLNTAREFYPFWMHDIKSIAAFSLHGGFDVQPLEWKPLQTTLKALTNRLKTEKFDVTETRHLMSYSQALKDKGAAKLLLETRLNLAKILLLQLKGAPTADSRVYRTAVDLTAPLFAMDENKQLFLYVIREFYTYWIDNEHPESNVAQDALTDE